MKSSRLPGKVMLPVLGRSMIALNIERLRRARTIRRVVVATSVHPMDDVIARLCQEEGIAVFRGSEEDVLDRIYRCACHFGMTEFAKLTADNPLIDPAIIDRVIGFYLEHRGQFDYVSNNHPPTWPDGQEVEVVTLAVLEVAWREARLSFQREHVTPYVWDQPNRFRIGNVALADDHLYHNERWTLDYPEDYQFIKRVFEELYPAKPDFGMNDVLLLEQARPAIKAINAHYAGITWYQQYAGALQTVRVGSRQPGE
jgi:spore coat polysaccharide biosynthesis protein SpsF